MTTEPLNLAHRVHVSTDSTGYRATCTCGWRTIRPTRDQRQADIDNHTTQ